MNRLIFLLVSLAFTIQALAQLPNLKKVVQKTESVASKMKTQQILSDITTGTFTDERDGTTYKTVTINGQVWMAENLRYKTENCILHENQMDTDKYGYLYTYQEALEVCPDGWLLAPQEEAWSEIRKLIGVAPEAGPAFKDKDAWKQFKSKKNNNKTQLSVLPGGKYSSTSNTFEHIGKRAYLWTSNNYEGDGWAIIFYFDKDNLHFEHFNSSNSASVRCVKN
jgi:uncharacterized protein (TIGR02145 family)